MATRSTEAQKLKRIREVHSYLLRATPRHEIVFALCIKWKCKPRCVDSYINATKKLIQKHFEEETLADFNDHYNDLIRVAMDKDDPYLKKQVLDSMIKLKGVVDKTEVNVNIYKTKFGDEDDRTV